MREGQGAPCRGVVAAHHDGLPGARPPNHGVVAQVRDKLQHLGVERNRTSVPRGEEKQCNLMIKTNPTMGWLRRSITNFST